MKKTFLTRRNALLAPESFSWGWYALGAVSILLSVRLLAPNFFIQVFTPILRSADALGNESHFFFSRFGNSAMLAVQNEQLQEANTTLVLENQSLLQKIDRLQAFLNSSGKSQVPQILADVLARPPVSPYDTLLLSEGTRVGVSLGMGVFVPSTDQTNGGIMPIGVVSFVTADFSRATLFSAPGVQTAAWVGVARIPLTLLGLGGGVFSASIARAAMVVVGDVVFVPGLGTPPMGKVVRIDSNPSSPVVVLRIQPTVNLFSVPEVLMRDVGASLRSVAAPAVSLQL